MKKLLKTSLSFLLFVTLSFAQNDQGDITLAPQIGYNFSTYTVSDQNVGYNSRNAFTAGIIGEYYFNDRWSLRTGMIYDPKGAEDGGNNIDKLNYITIPLNANSGQSPLNLHY